MLTILLKILSIIGILLLCLLGLLLVCILLVLVFPIVYRAQGWRKQDEMLVEAKVHWLFGLVRVHFGYPVPGNIKAKLLCFTIFDSGQKKTEDKTGSDEALDKQPDEQPKQALNSETKSTAIEETSPEALLKTSSSEQTDESSEQSLEDLSWWEKLVKTIFEKYEKIKYTILGIYAKIKHILEDVAYYKALFTDEETKALFHHVWLRFGKILKSIRPRKLKADIHFGTGSPDTTGYCLGIYGMLMPVLGKNVTLTPNFEEKELNGDFYVAGHITIYVLLMHVMRVLLDKRLRLFIRKIKKQEEYKNGR